MNLTSLFQTTFLFLIVMDPLGNIPLFLGVLRHFDPRRQREIIWREMLIALAIMVFFLFFGQGFFHLLNIDQASLEIAGGIILFLIAMKMVFATPKPEKTGHIPKDPLIVPLAMPAVAGPGILATISLYGGIEGHKVETLLAVVLAWGLSLPILLPASYLRKLLGENGLVAAERLFGYLIVLISAQLTLSGIQNAFK